MMSPATKGYADWCDETALCFIHEANILEEYGLPDKAKLQIDAAHKLYAEARLIRAGEICLDEFATNQFLYRRTRN